MSYQIWVWFILVYQKTLKRMFKTGFWVQNHLLNLCTKLNMYEIFFMIIHLFPKYWNDDHVQKSHYSWSSRRKKGTINPIYFSYLSRFKVWLLCNSSHIFSPKVKGILYCHFLVGKRAITNNYRDQSRKDTKYEANKIKSNNFMVSNRENFNISIEKLEKEYEKIILL